MKKRIISLILCVLTICPCFCLNGYAESVFNKEGFSSAVLEGWANKAETINIRSYNVPDSYIYNEYLNLLVTHPEYVNVYSQFTSVVVSTNFIKTVSPVYFGYTDDEIKAFNDKVDSIVASFSGRSDLDKVIGVYEYLIENAKYDYRSDEETIKKYSAYEAIMGDRTVCQGYSLAFCLLCQKMGIECHYISSEKNDHAWNLVKINDSYYYVDTTWDYYNHKDLLVGENTLVANDHSNTAGDWLIDYTAVETKKYGVTYYNQSYVNGLYNDDYSGFWQDAVNRMSYADGYWYYTDGKDIYKANSATNEVTKLTDHSDSYDYFWFSSIGANTGYSNRSDIEYYDGKIYFTTPTEIRCIDTDGKNETVVYTLTAAENKKGYIYDIRIEDGKIEYKLSFDPLCVNYIDRFTYSKKVSINCGKHSMGDWQTDVPSTCCVLGTDKRQCKNCLYTETRTSVTYAEHIFGNWKLIEAATCTKAGVEKRVCTVKGCNGYETRNTALGAHTYGDWVVKSTSTCTTQGVRTRICTKCKAENSEKLPYADHICGTDGNCTVCGTRVCTCLCHKTGCWQTWYKIVRFFWKIFDYNNHKTCACGATHY